jgi:predicted ATPase with chaperone activity
MALGLVGCMGHFFGKVPNGCMFLGELSLDGTIRPVRGALSAALAARQEGFKSVAVPETNAREAAVVEGVDVFALKSLPQAVDLVNAPESFQPVGVNVERTRQIERYRADKKTYANAQMMPKMIRKYCAMNTDGEKLLENAITKLGLSARAHDRILKVARTIADLDAHENIEPRHLSEAIQYRTLDRSYWA